MMLSTSVGVRLREDAVGRGELIDVLAQEVADEGGAAPPAGRDELREGRTGPKEVGREAST